ncbi:MAG: hypothetical protein AMXMBFR64_29360 [Myxococcales bacterium]
MGLCLVDVQRHHDPKLDQEPDQVNALAAGAPPRGWAAPTCLEAQGLVERGSCFVVHAPRQTGKTTSLRALARTLTAEGRYAALAFSCEAGSVLGDQVGWRTPCSRRWGSR